MPAGLEYKETNPAELESIDVNRNPDVKRMTSFFFQTIFFFAPIHLKLRKKNMFWCSYLKRGGGNL